MIKKLLLTFGTLFTFALGFSQTTIAVPFTEGFIGTYSGSNSSPIAYYLTSLGISNVRFTQVSATGQFTAQGNDIPGNLVFVDNSGTQHSIPGAINWRGPSGNNIVFIGFIPATTTNVTIATNGTNGTNTYNIIGSGVASTYTTIGVIFNGQTYTFTNGGQVSGNAANTGILDALNTYLGSLPALTINNVTVTEGPGTQNAVLTVTLNPSSANTVTVNYATADNTGVQTTNYTPASGTLTFTPGSTTRNITVPIVDNFQADNNKTVYVNLTNPTNAAITGSRGTITISDTDAGTLSTIESANKIGFQLAQNPVKNGKAVFSYQNVRKAQVKIFDAQGKAVLTAAIQGTSGLLELDVTSLPKGVYMAVLQTEGQAALTKLIVP